MLGLALRTLARHAVPLVVASVIAFAPVWWFVLRLPAPEDGDAAKQLYRLAWVIAATAWLPQYVLVGAAAPLARRVAAGAPASQLRAFPIAFAGLARGLIPCAIAFAAIAIGSAALVVPGIVLAVLLALTAASEASGLPEPLLDSIAFARAHLRAAVLVVVAIVGVDLAVAAGAYFVVFEPIAPKKPTAESLEAARAVVRLVALGLTLVSPIAACVLAALRARR